MKRGSKRNTAAPAVLVRLDEHDLARLSALASKARYSTQTSLARDALSLGLDAIERLEALAERLPFASAHGLAREVLRIGLEEVERDPARLVQKG